MTAAAFVVGFYLRVSYISFGLPYLPRADELTNFNVIQGMVSSHRWNPEFFRYPSLMFYLNLPVEALVSNITGGLEPAVKQTLGNGIMAQPSAMISARAVTLLFGSGLIILGHFLAKSAGLGKVATIAFVWMIALDPLLLRHSTFVTPDVIATFFVTASLICAIKISGDAGNKWYVAAGIFAGLAASTKYNAGLVAITIPVAHFLNVGDSFSRLSAVALAIIAAIGTLLLTSPFLLLDSERALEGFLFELNHYKTGHPGAQGDTFVTNMRWLFQQTGWAAIGAIGIVLSGSKLRTVAPVLVFVACYFLLISAQNVRFERNILPILPAVFLIILAGIDTVLGKLHTSGYWAIPAVFIFLTITWQTPLQKTARDLANYSPTTNAAARQWLEDRVSETAHVGLDAYSPHLQTKSRTIIGEIFILNEPSETLLAQDAVLVSHSGSARFLQDPQSKQTGIFRALENAACRTEYFPKDPPQAKFTLFHLNCE